MRLDGKAQDDDRAEEGWLSRGAEVAEDAAAPQGGAAQIREEDEVDLRG